MQAIYKGRNFIKTDTGKRVGPFDVFEPTSKFLQKAARNPHILTRDDFRRKLYDMSRRQLRQMCQNADLSKSGNTADLRDRLMGLFDVEPEDDEPDDDGGAEVIEDEQPTREVVLESTREGLRDICREWDLKVGGNKQELQRRILDHFDYTPIEEDDDEVHAEEPQD